MKSFCKTKLQKYINGNVSPKKGDIWWVNYMAFDGNAHGKGRPILITEVSGDTVAYYKCTSQSSQTKFRYQIEDSLKAGLDKDTYVITERQTLPRTKLSRCIGHLSKDDMIGVGLCQ